MNRILKTLVLLAPFVAAVVLLWPGGGSTAGATVAPEPRVGQPGSRAGATPSAPVVASSPAVEVVRTVAAGSERVVRFQVVDEQGETQRDVRIRVLGRGDADRLATVHDAPDPGGVISVGVPAASQLLRAQVECPGFAYGWCDPVSDKEVNRVVLQRSLRLEVRCRTRAGDPVPDCVVDVCAASAITWQEDVAPADCFGDHVVRRHRGRTDAQGNCVLEGLTRNRYFLAATHPHMVVISRLPEGNGLRLEADQVLDIVLVEPLVAASAFTVEPTIQWRRFTKSLGYPHPVDGRPERILGRLNAEAERRQLVALGHSIGIPEVGANYRYTMVTMGYLPGAGWVVEESAYRPAAAASVDVLSPDKAVSCDSGRLQARLLDGQGNPSVVQGALLVLQSLAAPAPVSGKHSLRLPLYLHYRLGERIDVPCGQYALELPSTLCGIAFRGERTVRVEPGADGVIELREETPVHELKISCGDERGQAIVAADIELRRAGADEPFRWSMGPLQPSCYLADGDYEVRVVAPGFQVVVDSLRVSPRDAALLERSYVLRAE